jgi:hypothetical protein
MQRDSGSRRPEVAMRACRVAMLIGAVSVATTAGFAPAIAQTNHIKIFLTVSQTPASIPAIPTADIARAVDKSCPNVTLTRNAEEADYSLEAVGGDRTNPHGQRLYKFTVFDKTGIVAFDTETRRLNNAMKDVCAFIDKHAR